MKKSEQIEMNEKGKAIINRFKAESANLIRNTRLRTCSACVMETPNFYILQSYATVIAIIEKSTDTLVDFLRIAYGYTATSAQHISKFSKDYGRGKWGCSTVLTMREV